MGRKAADGKDLFRLWKTRMRYKTKGKILNDLDELSRDDWRELFSFCDVLMKIRHDRKMECSRANQAMQKADKERYRVRKPLPSPTAISKWERLKKESGL